uniref:Uncharacterized protein n=2 Tax=Ciona intestinalis TaxID=7719 RepID=F6SLV3_CIOIN
MLTTTTVKSTTYNKHLPTTETATTTLHSTVKTRRQDVKHQKNAINERTTDNIKPQVKTTNTKAGENKKQGTTVMTTKTATTTGTVPVSQDEKNIIGNNIKPHGGAGDSTTISTQADTTSGGRSLNTTIIILVICSVLLFVAVLLTALQFYCRKRKKKNGNPETKKDAEVAGAVELPLVIKSSEVSKSPEEEKLQPDIRYTADSGFISHNSDPHV